MPASTEGTRRQLEAVSARSAARPATTAATKAGRHLPGDADQRGDPAPSSRRHGDDIAAQAQKEGVRDLRQSGLHKVRAGVTTLDEVIADQRVRHRQGRGNSPGTRMATATSSAKNVKDLVFEWEGKDRTARSFAARCGAGGEPWSRQPAAPGHPGHQDQEAPHQRRQSDQAEGHRVFTRQLATMMKAGVPLPVVRHRRRGNHQPQADAPAQRHPRTSRPAPACRRRSASIRSTSTRCTATSSRRARRAAS